MSTDGQKDGTAAVSPLAAKAEVFMQGSASSRKLKALASTAGSGAAPHGWWVRRVRQTALEQCRSDSQHSGQGRLEQHQKGS